MIALCYTVGDHNEKSGDGRILRSTATLVTNQLGDGRLGDKPSRRQTSGQQTVNEILRQLGDSNLKK